MIFRFTRLREILGLWVSTTFSEQVPMKYWSSSGLWIIYSQGKCSTIMGEVSKFIPFPNMEGVTSCSIWESTERIGGSNCCGTWWFGLGSGLGLWLGYGWEHGLGLVYGWGYGLRLGYGWGYCYRETCLYRTALSH